MKNLQKIILIISFLGQIFASTGFSTTQLMSEIPRNTELTKYVLKTFNSDDVKKIINITANTNFETTEEGIIVKKGYAGSSQDKSSLKPAEIEALDAIAKRSGLNNKNTPEFIFAKKLKDGYKIKSKSTNTEITIKHPKTKNVKATLDDGAIVYKNAYKDSDIFYTFGNNQCQELILLKSKKSPTNFEYDFGKNKLSLTGNGDLLVAGMRLSHPVIIDAKGKKLECKYQIKANRAYFSFNNKGLTYPLLVDPVWVASANTLTVGRAFHTATLLPNGKVLIAGGYDFNSSSILNTAELYDPLTGIFTPTGNLNNARKLFTATLLPNGKVLLTGGYGIVNVHLNSAELYDPSGNLGVGSFANIQSMKIARVAHTATLLNTGDVLITGGFNTNNDNLLSSCEIYNYSDGSFTLINSMSKVRAYHTATLLKNGKVLITGGYGADTAPVDIPMPMLATAEIYNPANGTFVNTDNNMTYGRTSHISILLPNDKVLITAGYTTEASPQHAELYDPNSGTNGSFTQIPSAVITNAREYPTATLLPNGKVLIVGGDNGSPIANVEIYDPANNNFTAGTNISTGRMYHTSTLLPNGKVLIAGGFDYSISLNTAELYDPSAGGSIGTNNNMSVSRSQHTSTLLPNGKVLVAGGYNTNSADLYEPTSKLFTPTGNMKSVRMKHSATLLPSGKVLIVGGTDPNLGALNSSELYNLDTGTFSYTSNMNSARSSHSATLLPNGKVLIAGGVGSQGDLLDTAELYSPNEGTFSYTTYNMPVAKQDQKTALLLNGNVLLCGGYEAGGYSSSAAIYNPTNDTFSATSNNMSQGLRYLTATLLPNGNVLIGDGYGYARYILYDPNVGSNGSFSDITYGSIVPGRSQHSAVLLKNGKVLLIGGNGSTGATNNYTLYDPLTGQGVISGTLTISSGRFGHCATLLKDGNILITGGWNNGDSNTAELINYTEYDYSTYSSSMQPSITSINSSSFPKRVLPNTTYSLSGLRFKGLGEGSFGSTSNSATNYPRVYLQKVGNEGIIDVTASLYPFSNWSSADTSISFKTPVSMDDGYYMLTVVVNGIPSDGKIIYVWSGMPLSTYTTMVGNATSWEWKNAGAGELIPSGSPTAWTWQAWTASSGRQVPQGTATSWTWGAE